MKRIKREVEDYLGAPVNAPAAVAAAAPTRGRSASRGPRVESNAVKVRREEAISRLKARGLSASATRIAQEVSAMERAKLSPTSGALNADRVKYEGIYKKKSAALKAMNEGKADFFL